MHSHSGAKKYLIASITIALLLCALQTAKADGAASIWTTYDTNPTHYRTEFLPGEVVYINWAPTGSSQNIRVYDANITLIADFGIVTTQPLQWQIPPNATAGSIYWIIIPGLPVSPYPISVATVQVLPETSWTPLAATILAFAVFTAIIKHRKKSTDQNPSF